MALTRSMLKAMGIEDEKIDQIIESHTDVTDALKKERDEFREQAAKVPILEKQIEDMSAIPNDSDEWKAKYEEEHQAFEAYKVQIEADKAKSEKAELYRSLLREIGIEDKRIDAILKVTDLESIEVSEGELSNRESLAEKAKDEWSEFIPQTRVDPAHVETPPNTKPDSFESLPLDEKMRFANENPNDPAVKAWLGAK